MKNTKNTDKQLTVDINVLAKVAQLMAAIEELDVESEEMTDVADAITDLVLALGLKEAKGPEMCDARPVLFEQKCGKTRLAIVGDGGYFGYQAVFDDGENVTDLA